MIKTTMSTPLSHVEDFTTTNMNTSSIFQSDNSVAVISAAIINLNDKGQIWSDVAEH